MEKKIIEIYTDGSCRGNGKENSSGGFGVTALYSQMDRPFVDYTFGEQCVNTTNNREELKAFIHALELSQTKYKDCLCYIYSDSAYVVNMCAEWIWSWYSRGWLRAGNKPIENLDLVKQIYSYLTIEFNNFTIRKVKGHNDVLGNEIADALATNDTVKLAKIFKENDLGIVRV